VKPNRLAGHTMPDEGRLYDARGMRIYRGRARCSCGAESEQVYTSGTRRRGWHFDHKNAIRAGAS